MAGRVCGPSVVLALCYYVSSTEAMRHLSSLPPVDEHELDIRGWAGYVPEARLTRDAFICHKGVMHGIRLPANEDWARRGGDGGEGA